MPPFLITQSSAPGRAPEIAGRRSDGVLPMPVASAPWQEAHSRSKSFAPAFWARASPAIGFSRSAERGGACPGRKGWAAEASDAQRHKASAAFIILFPLVFVIVFVIVFRRDEIACGRSAPPHKRHPRAAGTQCWGP